MMIPKKVVWSTLAAEPIRLQEGVDSNLYFRHILQGILGIFETTDVNSICGQQKYDRVYAFHKVDELEMIYRTFQSQLNAGK